MVDSIELNEIQTQCPRLLERGLQVADGAAQCIYFDNVTCIVLGRRHFIIMFETLTCSERDRSEYSIKHLNI